MEPGGVKDFEMGNDLMDDTFEVRADAIEEGIKGRFSVADDEVCARSGCDKASTLGAVKVNTEVEVEIANIADNLKRVRPRSFIEFKEPIEEGIELKELGEGFIDGGGKEEVGVRRFDSPKDRSG